MVKRHNKGYGWKKDPIDSIVMHASGGGKEHGQ
jgi:hypothetical protein